MPNPFHPLDCPDPSCSEAAALVEPHGTRKRKRDGDIVVALSFTSFLSGSGSGNSDSFIPGERTFNPVSSSRAHSVLVTPIASKPRPFPRLRLTMKNITDISKSSLSSSELSQAETAATASLLKVKIRTKVDIEHCRCDTCVLVRKIEKNIEELTERRRTRDQSDAEHQRGCGCVVCGVD